MKRLWHSIFGHPWVIGIMYYPDYHFKRVVVTASIECSCQNKFKYLAATIFSQDDGKMYLRDDGINHFGDLSKTMKVKELWKGEEK